MAGARREFWLTHVLRDLIPNSRELGIVNALCYDFDRILQRLPVPIRLYRYVLVAQPIPPTSILPPRRGASIAVRRVSPRDPRLLTLELTDDVLAYREGQDAVCLAAFKDDAMIGCLWFCLGPYREDEIRCRFTPAPADKTSWDFGAYVLPAHRSSLTFLRLWDEANTILRRQGVRWSLSRISAFNQASLRSHGSLGTISVGHATTLCIGSWQMMYCSDRPRLHLSTGAAQTPQVMVRAPDAK